MRKSIVTRPSVVKGWAGAVLLLLAAAAPSHAANLALNRPATVSSSEGAAYAAGLAVDGNTGTRWASAWSDPQWIQVDLGAPSAFSRVVLRWEAAYGRSYQVQTSNDAVTWTTIYSTTTGDGAVDDLAVSGNGRYVRVYATVRGTAYGYSLWEFEVESTATPTPTVGATPTSTATATSTPTATPASSATATATATAPPTATATATAGGAVLLSLNRPATASSTENAGTGANLAVDGNAGTRWSSAVSDPQWITVDLGSTASITRVRLIWEAAYATSYQVQVSTDNVSWTNLYSTTTGDGGTDDLALSGSGRYVRMYGTVRATGWGYSLWEFEVYGTSGATPTATPTATATPTTPTGSVLISQGRACLASSVENASLLCNNAFDGNTTTRWASLTGDPQWIYVDLGATATVTRVVLNWEAAYGTAYQIQTSGDAVNWATIYSTAAGNGGIDDIPLSGSGRYVRMYGTARATAYGYSLWEFQVYGTGGAPTPTASPVSTFWGDTSTIPPATQVLMFKFLNKTNGRYPDSQVYWSFNGTVHTIAEQPYFDMPANSAGRMYFGLGAPPDPANPNAYWDFIEFTIGPTVFNGNTTRVDALGLKLAMRLHCADGYDAAVGENEATFAEDRAVTFQRYIDSVPTEFKPCGTAQAPYRIPEPGGGCGFNAGGPYATYYDSYINTMWANNGITIPKPGPNGSGLGAYPDLSAAIFRHVGAGAGTFDSAGHLINQQLWSNPATFYTAAPAHYYAKWTHDISINGLSYGFPYDDVGGYSSFIAHGSPQWLVVAIGW